MNLNTITVEPPDFVVSPVTLPYAIAGGATLTLSVTYSPSRVATENGVIDLAFNEVPDGSFSDRHRHSCDLSYDREFLCTAASHGERRFIP